MSKKTEVFLYQVIKFSDNGQYAIARHKLTIETIKRAYTIIQTDLPEKEANDLCDTLMAEVNQAPNPLFN